MKFRLILITILGRICWDPFAWDITIWVYIYFYFIPFWYLAMLPDSISKYLNVDLMYIIKYGCSYSSTSHFVFFQLFNQKIATQTKSKCIMCWAQNIRRKHGITLCIFQSHVHYHCYLYCQYSGIIRVNCVYQQDNWRYD
jgi:hypothetical protein